MKTIVLSASLAVLAAGAAQLDPQGVEQKKYVAFGMEYTYLTPQDFVDHADQFMKTPLDGVGVVMNGGKGTPRAYQCFRWILNAPRWTREQFRDYVEPLRKMSEYPCFKESFLWSWYPPKKRLDWTDDEAWNIASNNLRVVAWTRQDRPPPGAGCLPRAFRGVSRHDGVHVLAPLRRAIPAWRARHSGCHARAR